MTDLNKRSVSNDDCLLDSSRHAQLNTSRMFAQVDADTADASNLPHGV